MFPTTYFPNGLAKTEKTRARSSRIHFWSRKSLWFSNSSAALFRPATKRRARTLRRWKSKRFDATELFGQRPPVFSSTRSGICSRTLTPERYTTTSSRRRHQILRNRRVVIPSSYGQFFPPRYLPAVVRRARYKPTRRRPSLTFTYNLTSRRRLSMIRDTTYRTTIGPSEVPSFPPVGG